MNKYSDYDADVRRMKSMDGREAGAACGAGAVSEETLMAAYDDMSRVLGRIREYEQVNNLPQSKWYYDGSNK